MFTPLRTLVIAFSLILALMASVTVIGYKLSRVTHEQIDLLMQGSMQKLDYLRQMQFSSMTRTAQLQIMFLSDDPFVADEAWIIFNEQAGVYIGLRDQLKSLLTPDGMALLQNLDKAGGRLSQIHREIGELFFNGNMGEAHRYLMEKAIPKRREFLEQLKHFYVFAEHQKFTMIEGIRQDVETSLFNMMYLILGVMVMSVVIGVYVFRHISKMAMVLAEANNTLEMKVSERTNELHIARDKLLKFNDDLKHLAVTDPLTGLSNRLMLDKHLRNSLTYYKERTLIFGVVIIDIDFFKKINDQYGHDVGDKVLKQFAKILKIAVRKQDSVGRWGGEEFMLICSNTSEVELYGMTEKLRLTIASYHFSQSATVTASFGMAIIEPEDTVHQVIKRADQALYLAKASGRNKVIVA